MLPTVRELLRLLQQQQQQQQLIAVLELLQKSKLVVLGVVVALVMLGSSCGPPELPYFTARAGDPCPGYGRIACDGPCTVLCWEDGGVWTVDTCNPKCGSGISVGVSDGGAP